MEVAITHVPQISVSPAPEESLPPEPYSPFSWLVASNNDDGFRSQHLTPPPTSVKFPRALSPLRPPESTPKGLERERFEALLKSSRERNSGVARKSHDLRKEIALKVTQNKQVERRALFLSKVLAPPSPTATTLPKTPPESPAIFHYTLPSPGLVSPLALFESLNDDPACGPLTYCREPWVEQVDFRLSANYTKAKGVNQRMSNASARVSKPRHPIPSLDQISAHLTFHGHVRSSSGDTGREVRRPSPPSPERPRLPIGVGRLQMPVRAPQPCKADLLRILPPRSPCSPLSPNLQVTTTLVPRSASLSPTELSETNLLALDFRERKARDMLSTLKRRTLLSDHGLNGHDCEELDTRKWRRHSAPADLMPKPRTGFEHPILTLPGAF